MVLTHGSTQSITRVNIRLTIDKAGRVVIPKPLREELHLEAGDALEMESAGEQITLRPVDTSVLVPVFYGDHVHHLASLERFIQFDKSTGCCGAHSLAEVFSTLTRMPGKHRISGEQAMLFIGSIRERLSIIALNGDEYADALEASTALGIIGGNIYDAMLAHCAIIAQAETIYSWNGKHYVQCGPEVTRRLRRP
jgi:AbrB family looped-hinge helix DNA binding protein